MKKVLIICHDFPPLSTVGAQRPFSWYNYLPEFGIHPVVITRQWSEGILDMESKFAIENISHSETSDKKRTLVKCSPKLTWRNRLIVEHGLDKKVLQRKLITARDLILSFFTSRYDEYHYLFQGAEQYVKSNKVALIICTGGPFELFKYGHTLSKTYGIPWIADYRDEWSRNFSNINRSWPNNLLLTWNALKEKKWTSNCLCFTTTSPPWKESIEKTIKKNGYLIKNGIDFAALDRNSVSSREYFELFYAGTIYDSHYIDIFCQGLSEFLSRCRPNKNEFKVRLIGIELNRTSGTRRFLSLLSKFSDHLEIISSQKHEHLIELAGQSTVCLNLVHGNVAQGIYPVKMLEYLALEKPIINIESIHGTKHEFSEFMSDCHSAEEFAQALTDLYKKWQNGVPLKNSVPSSAKRELDRKFQCQKLAELINQSI